MESAASRSAERVRSVPTNASTEGRRALKVVDVRAHPDALIAGGLFLLAALLRMAYVAWAPVFIGGDSLQYYQPVYDLMNGHGLTLSLKRPPAYPAMILAIQSVFGTSFVPIALTQHLLGAGTVSLTYGLGRLTFGRWAGMLAALLVAVTGETMRWEHFLMSEALFTFCFVLAVFLVVVGLRRPGWWAWVGAGLALGLDILTRPAAQVLLFVVPVVLLFVERAWRPAAKKTAIVLGVCALVTVPWMFRNLVVHGAFTPAGAAGQNLVTYTAIIHRPDFSFDDPLVVAVDADPKKATARKIVQKAMEDKLARPQLDVTGLGIHNRIMEETRMSQAQADAVMRDIALRAIASRPGAYLRDTAQDFVTIFHGQEEDLRSHAWDLWSSRNWRGPIGNLIGPASPAQEASYDRLATLDGLYHPSRAPLPLAVLFVLGLGLALWMPEYRPGLAPALAALALVLISAATVGAVPRYRLPPDPLINVVAMGGLVGAVTLLARRGRRTVGSPKSRVQSP